MSVDISFSINGYDYEGSLFEKGIFLHFGDARIKVCDDVDGLGEVIDQIEKIKKEIESY